MSITNEQADATCYHAESLVWRDWTTFYQVDEQLFAFFERVVSSAFVRSRWPKVYKAPPKLKVVGPLPYSKSFRNTNRIELGRYDCTDWSLLHELAHLCANEDGHGPKFLTAQIQLVTRFIDPRAGRALRHAYKSVELL